MLLSQQRLIIAHEIGHIILGHQNLDMYSKMLICLQD